MAPDQALAAVKTTTETSSSCTCGHEEATATHQHQHQHERKLSSNTSSSPTSSSPALSSASSSTNYLPASNKLSCESIPYPYAGGGAEDLAKLSSFSSTSSYESFFHIEGEALDVDDNFDFGAAAGIGDGDDAAAADISSNDFTAFEPAACTTRPPAVQTMMTGQGRQQRAEAAAAFDPKRLPSSMFRTRSTNPVEWSATSNESLFSIKLSGSAADQYTADLYYDAAGFPRFPSLKLPSMSMSSESSGRSGGLCVRHDCVRCVSGSKTRKSVRFAATESVSGDGKHSVVVSRLAVEVKETESTEAPAAGWCELGCCLGSSWWPRCCGCNGCGCHCKWWF